MQLFAIQSGDGFIKKSQGNPWELVPLAKASVFPTLEMAVSLKEQMEADGAAIPLSLVELQVTVKPLPWPDKE